MKIYKQKVLADAHIEGIELSKKAISDFCATDSFNIYYNENGKPLCDKCCFNISHKRDIVICAVSDKEIGIDVEEIKDIKKRAEYKLFTAEESDFVNSDPDKLNIRYLTVFTMKEAFVKMRGARLSDSAKLNTVSRGKLKTEFADFCFKTQTENGFIITVCERK